MTRWLAIIATGLAVILGLLLGIVVAKIDAGLDTAGAKLGQGRVPDARGLSGLYSGGIIRKVGGCGVDGGIEAHPRDNRCIPVPAGQPPISFAIAPADESGSPRACGGPAAIGHVDDAVGGLRLLLDAIQTVETGGEVAPARAVGDGGRAHGWLQQHEGHWHDGCEVLRVNWPWPEATSDRAKCEAVAKANWQRYAPQYLDPPNFEELARRFRLPFAPHRPSNDAYWARVRAELDG